MCGLQLLMDQPLNDWDLQAVVRSCGTFSHPDDDELAGPRYGHGEATEAEAGELCMRPASSLCDLDLDQKPFFLTTPSQAWDDSHQVMISFPAAVPSGAQPRASPGRKPVSLRTSRSKQSKKNQLKKVVCEVPVSDAAAVSSDLWAWRKYGQKPIKGSPYPRGYYKCSSMKGCIARKMVEQSVTKPGVLIITYMAEHCHPVPTQINALAGTTRQRTTSASPAEDRPTTSPKSDGAVKCEGGNGTPSVVMPMDGIKEEAAVDDEDELWMGDFFTPEFDHGLEEDADLGRRLSL